MPPLFQSSSFVQSSRFVQSSSFSWLSCPEDISNLSRRPADDLASFKIDGNRKPAGLDVLQFFRGYAAGAVVAKSLISQGFIWLIRGEKW